MMDFILRKLIKNYDDVNNLKVRTSYGKFGALVGIISNIILIAIKLVAGILANSIALFGSAIDSIADSASSLATLIGFKIASRPADKKHPFGHQRMEYITGFIISCLIIIVAIELGISSVKKIINPEEVIYSTLTIVILAGSILIKLIQSLTYKTLAKRIDSVALLASSVDARNDIISLSAVLVGTIISLIANINIDGYLGVLTAIFVLLSGIGLAKEAIDELIGVAPEGELVSNMIQDIKKHKGVLGLHDFTIHQYGANKIFASIHVEVDGKVDIFDSHDLVDNIEKDIKEKYKIELVCHMDPIVIGDKELDDMKIKIGHIISNIDPHMSYHDFRIVRGPTHTNIIFDIVLAHECELTEQEIYAMVLKEVKKIDKKYEIVINFDHNYLG